MSDYDNTNRGVCFKPFPDAKLLLQGRANIDGNDYRAVVVKHPLTRDGEPQRVLYIEAGVLFPNEKNGNEKAPEYSGRIKTIEGWRVSAWKRATEAAGAFLSFSFQPPFREVDEAERAPETSRATDEIDDEIPF